MSNTGQISDGYHTFDELYYHRMVLFSVICNTYRTVAWKSWLHHDGTMYQDYFIVGVSTEQGDYSYHYHKDYWNLFNVKELPTAPEYDGHLPSDIDRLFSLIIYEPISIANLDKRICDCEPKADNTQTYREFIRESEDMFGMCHEPIDMYSDDELVDYIAELDYLWEK